ncbi:hypothetical protein BCR36DRAFT_584332 [Piromyces finnis]|uniref:Alpha/beta-hydrolase n=1 Tax=Piromyces finnis TaxID=1754191 RepID=A0A1Y1V6R1_9FUNG|nr:hypothetical protein BCR36DRAFT_584332 [Piromyces finnis]|eukprot:ORX48413.1 hypothetical protein BCR36DRAFT_584332 [Piromyces finnis]
MDEKNETDFSQQRSVPIIIYNSYNSDAKELWDECLKMNCSEFVLVVVEVVHWNDSMTPFPSEPIFNKSTEGYGGMADDYINFILEDLIPTVEQFFKPEYYAITGYSLSGLFSVYCMYKTDKFSRVLSGSGSFWYPGFMDYIANTPLKVNIDTTKVYLSLGNKEKKTGNKVLKTIETETLKYRDYLSEQKVNFKFEFNQGGHFNDVISRIAKGIKWLLE